MSGQSKGIIGSIAIHLGIVAAFVGVSWVASHQSGKVVQPVDPMLVSLDGIPGRRPGEIGKRDGVAHGDENGDKKGVATIHIKHLDVDKILRDRQQAEAEAQAENANSKTNGKNSTKTANNNTNSKTTLSDFMNSKGGHGSGKATVGGISGATVKGRNYGTGENGGEGGSASEQQVYAGEVEARFRSAWTSLIAAEGASISAVGNCGVTLNVDSHGRVTFAGWLARPADAHMADLVVRACGQIGNCGTPPGGRGFKIDFTKVGVSEG